MPQNIDMERAVLGAMLTDQDASVAMIPEFQGSDFFVPSHGRLFDVMRTLFNAGVDIDVLTVDNELRIRGEEKLTAAQLCDMAGDIIPSIAMSYLPTLKKLSRARALIRLCISTTDKLFDMADEPTVLAMELATEALGICEDLATGFESIAEPTKRVMRDIERAADNDVNINTVPSGLTVVDARAVIRKGALIVIAGRPGMGKTSMALTIARNAALRGYPGAYVTAEGRSESLVLRTISGFSDIENSVIRAGRFGDGMVSKLVAAAAKVMDLPISTMDRQRSWDAIKASLRTLRMRVPNLSVVAVDYIGLLRAPTRQARRDLEVGRISSEASELAIELNVAFLLLCQLNRNVESRDDKKPNLSDLRDSGDIEQDADVVLFPFRPVYYDDTFQPRDMMELAIAKNRDGPTGSTDLSYNERLTLVEDREVVTTQTEGEQR